MAIICLDTLWLHDAEDLSDCIRLNSTSGLQRVESTDVSYQVAGSRVRQVVHQSWLNTWRVDCVLCPADELAWLRVHRTRLLCARDHLGRKIFGSYPELDDAPLPDLQWASQVSFTLTEVTHSEAV